MLSLSKSTDRAKKAACINNMTNLKIEYYLTRMSQNAQSLQDFGVEFNKEKNREITQDGLTYSTLCPADGTYTVSLDQEGRLTVKCSVHGDLSDLSSGSSSTSLPKPASTSEAAKTILDIDEVRNELALYFKNNKSVNYINYNNTAAKDIINSIIAYAQSHMDIDMSNYIWKVTTDSSRTKFTLQMLPKADNFAAGGKYAAVQYTYYLNNPNRNTVTDGTATLSYSYPNFYIAAFK